MELQPNPHAMKSGDIFSKGLIIQMVKRPTLSERGLIRIWKRCIKRWEDNDAGYVCSEKRSSPGAPMPLPLAFYEMKVFIEDLEQ